ncbi:polysaccharide pyruvyl transferase family protein [Marinobacter halodurans]|uniref:Polysaccharide pyruvyl transferase family protein n=1 Tax=Marinobacter halodurans TaxID=2528979 RepID=A0ABY1ZNV0_9GAMM|nr:polysaccharide pyruvyl transferase family protein [Marinobacter halodurans]TBW58088.1 polysaccharide pyruvyl transferase family protein [Marinobacter halodurans]
MKLSQPDFEALVRKECSGSTLTLASFPGNAGDHLITMCSLSTLEKLGLKVQLALPGARLDENARQGTLLVAGGGNLVPLYDDVARLIRQTRDVCRRLVVLPHTIAGHEPLLQDLPDGTLIFCREKPSFDYVSQQASARTYLCDDMVFYGDMSLYRQSNLPLTWLRELLGAPWAKGLNRRKYIAAKLRLLGSWCIRRLGPGRIRDGHLYRTDRESAGRTIPSDNCDASVVFDYGQASLDRVRESARDFVNYIDQFDIVRTDRLHACIAAARLGKTVYFSGGSYHKCRSVYENSIDGQFDNVIWT